MECAVEAGTRWLVSARGHSNQGLEGVGFRGAGRGAGLPPEPLRQYWERRRRGSPLRLRNCYFPRTGLTFR